MRNLKAVMVVLAVFACIGGALSLPFLFESQTMYYKFGGDKILLRSAKMAGLAAAVLLLLQLPLSGRLKCLDRLFSLPALYRFHRFNAYLIGILAVTHPLLVLGAEGRWLIPLELRYWPEWGGVTLLAATIIHLASSLWRGHFFRTYHHWRRVHHTMGIILLILLMVHILYVSEPFEFSGLPRNLVFGAAIGSLLLWLWIRVSRFRTRKKMYKVIRIEKAGATAYRVDLEAESPPCFTYMPGQFAFLSFKSAHISGEYHPFTLSSAPSRPEAIQVIIRCCGDWTNRISTVQKDELVFIQGPFGRFNHLSLPQERGVIMIAGGIGITPMLSMLRYMDDHADPRRITLIWSNRTKAHQFGVDELTALREKLTNFTWVPIITRETGNGDRFDRLDRHTLETLLAEHDRSAAVFLCGPPPMVKQIQKDLKKIGFAAKSMHLEVFGF